MSIRTLSTTLVAALAVLAGGCGGGGTATGTDSAASIVPASAVVYASINLDSDSDQWKKAATLVDKFPDGRRLLRQAVQELEEDQNRDWERDIKPALGDQLAFAVLDFQDDEPVLVAILKPDDKDKLNALLADEDNEPAFTTEVDGWTVVSDKQASLDALQRAAEGDTLADSDDFQATMDDLGDETLASVYVNGARLVEVFRGLAAAEGETQTFEQLFSQGLGRFESAGTALLARDDGVEWKALAKGRPAENGQGGFGDVAQSFDTTLDERVPSGALAFLSFNGSNYKQQLENLTPQQQSMLRQIESMLGISIDELADLLSGEGGVYVRPGAPFPEATLILKVTDEAQARAVLDRLARRLAALGDAQVQQTEIAGVQAGQVRVGSITIAYAVFDGMAVVTTSPAGIEALREGGDTLSDDDAYKDALETAGVPDESSGFLFWNIEDTVPLLRSYAQLSDESIPPELWTNLGPLRSFVLYASGDEDTARADAFLKIE